MMEQRAFQLQPLRGWVIGPVISEELGVRMATEYDDRGKVLRRGPEVRYRVQTGIDGKGVAEFWLGVDLATGQLSDEPVIYGAFASPDQLACARQAVGWQPTPSPKLA